ncbi:MAG TPA: hypothetical protein ENH23_00805 [candidate division Zixibacteria bacterium]|nr:hypothetical protein [candidate division Zixibacteria bacterium]
MIIFEKSSFVLQQAIHLCTAAWQRGVVNYSYDAMIVKSTEHLALEGAIKNMNAKIKKLLEVHYSQKNFLTIIPPCFKLLKIKGITSQ